MIRQPVSVGGSGGGADYESFRVEGDDDRQVQVYYTDLDGRRQFVTVRNSNGRVYLCQKNSVYVYRCGGISAGGNIVAGCRVENGMLILSITEFN